MSCQVELVAFWASNRRSQNHWAPSSQTLWLVSFCSSLAGLSDFPLQPVFTLVVVLIFIILFWTLLAAGLEALSSSLLVTAAYISYEGFWSGPLLGSLPIVDFLSIHSKTAQCPEKVRPL
jgi:hypothetical protein